MTKIMGNLRATQRSMTCCNQSRLHGGGGTWHKLQGHWYLPSCWDEAFLASRSNTNKGIGKNKHSSQPKLYKSLMIKSNANQLSILYRFFFSHRIFIWFSKYMWLSIFLCSIWLWLSDILKSIQQIFIIYAM